MAHTIRRAMASDAETLARLRFEFRASVESADTGLDAFIARAVPWMSTRLDQGDPGMHGLPTATAPPSERIDAVMLWPTPRSRGLYERYGFTVRDDVMMRR